MVTWHKGLLDAPRASRVEAWLGDPELVTDLSWGLVDTAVLHVRASSGDVIVKTAGAGNTHLAREIRAHRGFTDPLVARARTSRMRHADADLRLIVLEYQAGILVQGSGRELSPDVHRPAGTDLCRLAVKEWRADLGLEQAFLDGYGDDPRDPELWRIDLLCEAIGTAAWAYQVNDREFEDQGHRQLAEALALF